jgi:hypothetical protein
MILVALGIAALVFILLISYLSASPFFFLIWKCLGHDIVIIEEVETQKAYKSYVEVAPVSGKKFAYLNPVDAFQKLELNDDYTATRYGTDYIWKYA